MCKGALGRVYKPFRPLTWGAFFYGEKLLAAPESRWILLRCARCIHRFVHAPFPNRDGFHCAALVAAIALFMRPFRIAMDSTALRLLHPSLCSCALSGLGVVFFYLGRFGPTEITNRAFFLRKKTK
jgi:hypothetical protein